MQVARGLGLDAQVGAARAQGGLDAGQHGVGVGLVVDGVEGRDHVEAFALAEGGIAKAQADADEAGSTNVRFVLRDAAALGEREAFDVITSFDAIQDQAHPDAVLAGIQAALRPGGTYLCVEPKASSHLHENLDLPMAPMLYTISTMHCMTVSLAYDGEGLGAAWGEQVARERLAKAGFIDVQLAGVHDDRANHYFLARRP